MSSQVATEKPKGLSFCKKDRAKITPEMCANLVTDYTAVLAKSSFTKYPLVFYLCIKYFFHSVTCESIHNSDIMFFFSVFVKIKLPLKIRLHFCVSEQTYKFSRDQIIFPDCVNVTDFGIVLVMPDCFSLCFRGSSECLLPASTPTSWLSLWVRASTKSPI